MGIDAEVWSKGIMTPEQCQEFDDRCIGVHVDQRPRSVELYGFEIIDADLDCGRYYSPHYTRGYWPRIAVIIEAMRAVFGNVYYHGDSTDTEDASEFTEDDMRAMWAFWRSPDWGYYHKERGQ